MYNITDVLIPGNLVMSNFQENCQEQEFINNI